jgi:hypothetical protein
MKGIKIAHLKIYNIFGGDGDALIRLGTDAEKKIMSYEIWKLIDNLIQDYHLVTKNLVSKEFSDKFYLKFGELIQSEEALTEFEKIAKKLGNLRVDFAKEKQ